MHLKNYSYVLISPAHNEQACIEKTIQSVVSQTILPEKWVIVSDGSTDRTDEIVQQYLTGNPWIELVRMPVHCDRHFAAKARCFNAGYQRVQDLDFDIIGNLDADISFEKDYFEFLLNKFAENPRLGVAGTPFVQGALTYDYRFTNIEHVSGACQLFRRKCFEDIGGYIPIKSGGIDWIAVTTARMKGWKTRTFTNKTCLHHRRIGTSNANTLVARFRHGMKDYYLASHPLWQLFRAIYQMKNKPYIIGGCILFAGYLWAFFCRYERPVSKELMNFHRKEQMARLKSIFLRTFKLAH
ncbi:MAG: glycosyltransferase [Aliifodinibius sp.]|nr:glycosyltransferase family 2 protein [Fodinibius sp.]NIV14819.1 glycosyltransferase [Fodinibius sp.]NIY28698.1 glycosyltransferase [Fodinibius sp.]